MLPFAVATPFNLMLLTRTTTPAAPANVMKSVGVAARVAPMAPKRYPGSHNGVLTREPLRSDTWNDIVPLMTPYGVVNSPKGRRGGLRKDLIDSSLRTAPGLPLGAADTGLEPRCLREERLPA